MRDQDAATVKRDRAECVAEAQKEATTPPSTTAVIVRFVTLGALAVSIATGVQSDPSIALDAAAPLIGDIGGSRDAERERRAFGACMETRGYSVSSDSPHVGPHRARNSASLVGLRTRD
jgi:hypothetical protein